MVSQPAILGAQAIALAAFQAEYEVELSFEAGEALTVLPQESPEGWLMAKNANGLVGLVPESYLDAVSAESNGGGGDGGDGVHDTGQSSAIVIVAELSGGTQFRVKYNDNPSFTYAAV